MCIKMKKHIGVICVILGMILFIHHPIITSQSMAVQGDGLMYYLSKVFWIDSLKGGEFPLWNPFSQIGTPFLADTQQTVLSPFNILYFLFDTTTAFNLTRLICLLMAGCFMYLLMYELTKKYVSSAVIGLLFALSTMLSGHRIEHVTIVTTICFFPAIFWTIEKFRTCKSRKWLIFTAVLMAFQFLSGFTQLVLYFDIVIFFRMIYVLKQTCTRLKEALVLCIKWILLYLLFISCQLLPTIQLILSSGRNDISWETFAVYGCDLRVLLMMLFPSVYFDEFQAFGLYASSGLDIEIYIGVICLVYIFFEAIYCRKERGVRSIGALAVGCFLYAMAPNVPILGRVIYSIPILNSFRVCARSLPIFVFLIMIITGIGLAHISDSEDASKIMKVNVALMAFGLFAMVFWYCVSSQQVFLNEYADYYKNVRQGIAISLGLLMIHFILLCFLEWAKKRRKIVYMAEIICGIIGLFIISDVMRFSILYNEQMRPVQTILNNGLPEEVQALVDKDTEDGYRSFVIMNDPDFFYSTDTFNIAKYGRSISSHNNMYNAWLTFLDKKLDYWGIKENVFYPHFTEELTENPSLAAMLSIHCILSAGDYDLNPQIINDSIDGEVLLADDAIEFVGDNDLLYYASTADWVEEYTSYLVTFDANVTNEDIFYADLYNDNYDNVEQDGFFVKDTWGGQIYRTIITTEEIPDNDIYFRILASGENDLSSAKVEIKKIELDELEIYEKIWSGNDMVVYASDHARKIVYIPEKAEYIAEYGESWKADELNNADKISYVLGLDKSIEFNGYNATITGITQKRNSVSAIIRTDEDTFVNHAQLAYPGWTAYVDGQRVKLYTVNNLIQGAIVPEGEHIIEFRYEPIVFKIGCVLSTLGIIFACVWWGKLYTKQRLECV